MAPFLLAHIPLESKLFLNRVMKDEVRTDGSSTFIKCRFEECSMTEEGALISTGDHELCVEKIEFVNCSTRTHCAGLKKVDGALILDCCTFNECHGEDGNRDMLGSAMGTSNSNVKCEDITFTWCWKQANPFADSVYGLNWGKADVKGINYSHCISRWGGLTGSFLNVEENAPIRYLQGISGEEYTSFEILTTDQSISFFNLINNSLTNFFLHTNQAKLKVNKGCFFFNNRYDTSGTVAAFDCISDSYPGSTTGIPLSTFLFSVSECKISTKFTSALCINIFPIFLFLILVL